MSNDDLIGAIDSLKDSIGKLDDRIFALLHDRDVGLKPLKNEIASLKSSIDDLTSVMKESDKKIIALGTLMNSLYDFMRKKEIKS